MWINIFRAVQKVTRILNPSISDSKVFMTLLGGLNSVWHPPAWIPPKNMTASTETWLCYWTHAHCTFSLWSLSLGTNLMPELERLPTFLPSWLVFLPFGPKAKLLSCLVVSTHDSFVGYNWTLPSVWAWSSPKKCSGALQRNPGSSVTASHRSTSDVLHALELEIQKDP